LRSCLPPALLENFGARRSESKPDSGIRGRREGVFHTTPNAGLTPAQRF
jgi:hypothetical protein